MVRRSKITLKWGLFPTSSQHLVFTPFFLESDGLIPPFFWLPYVKMETRTIVSPFTFLPPHLGLNITLHLPAPFPCFVKANKPPALKPHVTRPTPNGQGFSL